MPLSRELEAWLRLSLTPGLGNSGLRRLLAAFGGPEQVLAANRAALAAIVPPPVAAALGAADGCAAALAATADWLQDPANRLLTLADDDYPQALLQIPDPPPLLYAKGRTELLNRRALAVVGSRSATAQGVETAQMFAKALSDAGLTIVSGLALGIDAAAHRGGLAGAASSIAVVGTGLDIVYPARNRALAHALARDGALVSELPLGTPAAAGNFPRRNRLISGLALGCLVVEAAPLSGSLITARLANEQGKDVFAVPGSIHSPLSKGCHQLIKQGAKLAESAQDILEELRLAPAAVPAADTAAGAAETALLRALGYEPCTIDALAARCGLSGAEVAAQLTALELSGAVAPLPGGRYQRVR
jgi:DNA processing protein